MNLNENDPIFKNLIVLLFADSENTTNTAQKFNQVQQLQSLLHTKFDENKLNINSLSIRNVLFREHGVNAICITHDRQFMFTGYSYEKY